ncbi:hypothetical protein [Streptomyces sp. NPDC004296]|uniref:hypothetical protein n=1 Tax=Streptomyces sp. NPDC004296 TaxID=3364697 RepID=UPI0036C45DD7
MSPRAAQPTSRARLVPLPVQPMSEREPAAGAARHRHLALVPDLGAWDPVEDRIRAELLDRGVRL